RPAFRRVNSAAPLKRTTPVLSRSRRRSFRRVNSAAPLKQDPYCHQQCGSSAIPPSELGGSIEADFRERGSPFARRIPPSERGGSSEAVFSSTGLGTGGSNIPPSERGGSIEADF